MTRTAALALAPASLARFIEYAEDADNWSGSPLVGGNVGGDPADVGYLTNMKRCGMVSTWEDEGDVWIEFTDAGRALAGEHGVEIDA
jgi:hypothetical protein